MSANLSDLGVPQVMTDGQGRLVLGDDLEVTSNQSASGAGLTLATTTGLKRRLLLVTVTYSASTSQNVPVNLLSGLGAAWNTLLNTIVITTRVDGFFIPSGPLVIAPGDSIQAVAPALGGQTVAIAIYCEILGLTARAVDATS